jgi:predicted anti-sigma-YlaC factor YlaD
MRCRDAKQYLQLYLDDRLTFEQVLELEQHLSRCPTCREELEKLEQVARQLSSLPQVAEPAALSTTIMRHVAFTSQRRAEPAFAPLRPSLREILAAIALATFASLGILLGQPAVRAVLPFANGHDALSLAFANLLHFLAIQDALALTVAFWIIGSLLGISITLLLAGNEMRTEWLRAVRERIPVHL